MLLSLLPPSQIIATLGARLRQQRLARNLVQSELAGMAGVSTATLKRIEKTGQCSVEAWVRVIKALGLVAELDGVFARSPESIAQMEQAAAASRRKRASRKSAP